MDHFHSGYKVTKVVRKEECINCVSLGRDTSKDNLNCYDDGHAHCYACGYHLDPKKGWSWPTQANSGQMSPKKDDAEAHLQGLEGDGGVILPFDATTAIDAEALIWLSKYGISSNEIIKYKMKWSNSRKMLIFTCWDDQKQTKLLAWQGRSFNDKYNRKYYKVGQFNDWVEVFNLTDGKGDDIILVEDYVSAIKLARQYTSCCMFGSTLSDMQMCYLLGQSQEWTFWLDNDKIETALELAREATQYGVKSKIILTQKDPKCYSDEEIKQYVETI